VTIRLYFDEDSLRHALVAALRKRGVDVLTALDARTIAETDEQQLEYAATRGRAIYSFNVGDFCRLHGQWILDRKSHAGIILARQRQFSVGEQMRRLLKLIGTVAAEELQNRIEFLSDWG
jgi:Domain of unknown function (DUF5615)